ncbi:hypothetical protein K3X44_10025 [Aliiroseovarius crassostreae]|uniref:hypothetical protein n=1 Tax=Aliiroseovarius crassostreae TaxID=154981 RepID=UPI0021FE03C4|nr:hypothetical protein [Aliiroseovarius crassostreae]UWQ00851.1 hypothetical protein K3X44_10025 [Aliiroseovarius crassostreae]
MSETLLSNLPQMICDQIMAQLPELAKCDPHAGKFDLNELKKKGLPAQSVLVSNLGGKQGQSHAGGARSFDLKMAAYVVTKDGLGKPRDVRAANICQRLLQLIPGKDWGEAALGEAREIAVQPLISGKTKDSGVALWAVSWLQPISFFEPKPGPLGAELYVSQAPAVGADHEASYDRIEGES